jgi:hypothetical protein
VINNSHNNLSFEQTKKSLGHSLDEEMNEDLDEQNRVMTEDNNDDVIP